VVESGAVMLQEYIPEESADDWIFHGYFNARSDVSWALPESSTGRGPVLRRDELRESRRNPELAAESVEFLRKIGYCGIVDMDWRLDRRDGRYRLLDCNPRVGAQFRLFESTAGIDVVRAQHLDLTGREVPQAPQVNGRGSSWRTVTFRPCSAIADCDRSPMQCRTSAVELNRHGSLGTILHRLSAWRCVCSDR
jgi:predicted ATP-grasp superfamily ATP-dependent carboligase